MAHFVQNVETFIPRINLTHCGTILVSYTCNPGFLFNDPENSETKTITCGADGEWEDLTHTCTGNEDHA